MKIAVEEVETYSPAVKAYRVVLTDSKEPPQPKAPRAELNEIGQKIFEELQREGRE